MGTFLIRNLFFLFSAISLCSVTLWGDTVTFAQFQEAGKGGNYFTYVNSANSAVFESRDPQTGSSSVPVTFSFLSFATNDLPGDLQGPQAAHMSFYVKTTQPVGTAGSFFDQNLYSADANGVPNYGTITFTRDTPDAELHETNLLTVSFYARAGGLDGIRRGQTAILTADNTANVNGEIDYVQFSSSYLDFRSGSDENLALSFTSANPCFTLFKNVTKGKGGCVVSGNSLLTFLHAFTAAGTGTFASDPQPTTVFATPEPASAALLLLSAPLMVLCLRRRKSAR
jgi:hypothetical protein